MICNILGEVTEVDSKFMYRASTSHSYYHHPEFEPNFDTNVGSYAVCGGSFACNYDYKMTSSESVAKDTRHIQEWVLQQKEFTKHGKIVNILVMTKICVSS